MEFLIQLGSQKHCFFIIIIPDNEAEGNERFTIQLTSSHPFLTFTNNEATVTIEDDTTFSANPTPEIAYDTTFHGNPTPEIASYDTTFSGNPTPVTIGDDTTPCGGTQTAVTDSEVTMNVIDSEVTMNVTIVEGSTNPGI